MLAPIRESTSPAMAVIRKTTKIAPKTGHPLPRTSARERPNAAITPERSITITGAMTAQIVSRNRPGTTNSTKPTPTPRPDSRPAPISGPTTGAAERISSPAEKSRCPSWMSRTNPTTMP